MDRALALRALAHQYPTLDLAAAALAQLSGRLEKRAQTTHLMSDIHGHYTKLRHVIGNGSGGVTHELERSFSQSMSNAEMLQVQKIVQYPVQMLQLMKGRGGLYACDVDVDSQSAGGAPVGSANESWEHTLIRVTGRLVDLIRIQLVRSTSVAGVIAEMPADFKALILELVFSLPGERLLRARREFASKDRLAAMPVRPLNELVVDQFLLSSAVSLFSVGRLPTFIRHLAHMIRNLVAGELVVVGDVYDRGPRADLCVDELQNLPETSITWGNHDVAWMGASLGQKALIAFVLRISCRYNQLDQLDEGYAIPLLHLREFAVKTYGNDPCPRHKPKRKDVRDDAIVAKMTKAIAIIQYKLDAQTIKRNPHWKMDHRMLLEGLDLEKGVLRVDGEEHPLLDKNWPTFNPSDPYKLSPEEEVVMDKYAELFTSSVKMTRHMRFIVSHGSMWTVRDSHLCFHACIPVDTKGDYLTFPIEGKELGGKELMDALDRAIRRAADEPNDANRDLFLYLWCGPVSPLFGKAKMATLERDFLKKGPTHKEPKNPYYSLINDVVFCDKLLADFGCDVNEGMIVNGHVPHQMAKGENPLKKSGKAIVIDGAFSDAYGDAGYTMVLKPQSSFLVEHGPFRGVDVFLKGGAENLPKVTVLRSHKRTRKAKEDRALAQSTQLQMEGLRQLIAAYRTLSVRGIRTTAHSAL